MILDFYENKKYLAIQEGSRWRIEDYFCSKIKLRIIIDDEMKLITAYPVWE